MNWGPRFGRYSQQLLEFDIEITEPGDYSIFAQHDILSTWADSVYITFDDQDPLTPEFLDSSNDIRWQPSTGDPAGAPETLLREVVVLDSGIDFWTLDAGEHTLHIACREPLGVFDWILITQDFAKDIDSFEEPDTEPPVGVQDYSIF